MQKLFAIFLIGICLLGAFLPSVKADGGDEWDDENDREVNFDSSGSSVEFESQDDVLGNELKFHAEVDSDGLFVEVEYKQSNDSTESEVKFRTVIAKVYEYQETNNVEGYQDGADTLVQSWDLGSQSWSSFSCSTTGTNPTVYSCDVESSVLGATVTVTDGVGTVNGVPLKPSGTKIDVYIEKASANPVAVAIGIRSDTESDFEVENESDEESEGFTSESEKQVSVGTSAFFSWVETATINSQTVNVINSGLLTNNDLDGVSGEYDYVVFSFETTEIGIITWDPKAAVGSTLSSGVATVVPSMMLLLVALVALLY